MQPTGFRNLENVIYLLSIREIPRQMFSRLVKSPKRIPCQSGFEATSTRLSSSSPSSVTKPMFFGKIIHPKPLAGVHTQKNNIHLCNLEYTNMNIQFNSVKIQSSKNHFWSLIEVMKLKNEMFQEYLKSVDCKLIFRPHNQYDCYQIKKTHLLLSFWKFLTLIGSLTE